VQHEPYTLHEVAARDGYRCGICRRTVPMARAVPHSLAPTIDHILPLAAGGDDTRGNVQLAHFECNWRKSDRVDFAQPLLVG
jgi:5-methylcytosine-specific restriction endonuclease McrA